MSDPRWIIKAACHTGKTGCHGLYVPPGGRVDPSIQLLDHTLKKPGTFELRLDLIPHAHAIG